MCLGHGNKTIVANFDNGIKTVVMNFDSFLPTANFFLFSQRSEQSEPIDFGQTCSNRFCSFFFFFFGLRRTKKKRKIRTV